jgi:hypothetical protein
MNNFHIFGPQSLKNVGVLVSYLLGKACGCRHDRNVRFGSTSTADEFPQNDTISFSILCSANDDQRALITLSIHRDNS